MISIYVVIHDTTEDTNVFFTSYEKAENFIPKIASATETDILEWAIVELKEGRTFDADMGNACCRDKLSYVEKIMYEEEINQNKKILAMCFEEILLMPPNKYYVGGQEYIKSRDNFELNRY